MNLIFVAYLDFSINEELALLVLISGNSILFIIQLSFEGFADKIPSFHK